MKIKIQEIAIKDYENELNAHCFCQMTLLEEIVEHYFVLPVAIWRKLVIIYAQLFIFMNISGFLVPVM